MQDGNYRGHINDNKRGTINYHTKYMIYVLQYMYMSYYQGDLLILEDHNRAIVPLAYDEVGGIKNIAWNNLPAVKVSAFGSHHGASNEVCL